jgi:hypothetical protein
VACPSDQVQPNTHECRAASDLCDAPEMCDGSGTTCPADLLQPNTFVCRPSAGICDVAETCTGTNAACPGDSFQSNTFVCRAHADVCDKAETCTGSSAGCPVDAYLASGQTDPGVCDTTKACDGTLGPAACKLIAGETCAAGSECLSGTCNLGDAGTGTCQ